MRPELFSQKEPRDRHFITSSFIHSPIESVFSFFSDCKNLERITPPWLNFKVLHQSTPQIQNGTIFEYQLKIHRVPVRWKTEILEWKPNERFVDTQRVGPYQKWHHLHLFWSEGSGTRMQDEVLYRLPMGFIGDFFGGWWVDRDVRNIFNYRTQCIHQYFGKAA